MNEIKRVRYFNGEFLFAEDFNADHEYHRTMRYRHNKNFHTWGIVTGLVVTSQPGETFVSISPGLAVDNDGREIVMIAGLNINFNTDDYTADSQYYITISWNQEESEPDENGNAKRWDESPVIDVSLDTPANPELDLILAKVTLDGVKVVSSVNGDERTVSATGLGEDAVTSSKIAEADGITAQDTASGSGVKTAHIQDGAITEAKLDSLVSNQLVTLGDKHDHSNGNGSQIKHSGLLLDGGVNPHSVSMSQLNDYNANNNRITNLGNPVNDDDAVNKFFLTNEMKSGGSFSSIDDIDNRSTGHDRQINVSETSSATATGSQVNASTDSIASGGRSQVNVSNASSATGPTSQVNASTGCIASGSFAQVNGSDSCQAHGNRAQINVSDDSETSANRTQINSSINSSATLISTQINASRGVETAASYTVCGGYTDDETISSSNRKWELNSSNGNISHTGSVSAPFSDYGEYFENKKKGEINMGVLIALDGSKVRPAKKGEDFIGVVSGTAAIRLGDTPFAWHGRYERDDWGRPVMEEVYDPGWKPAKGQKEKDRPKIKIQKVNKNFDPGKEQVPRSQRPKEWTLVGLLGQVYVRCDDSVQPGDFIKSAAKGLGTKSKEKTQLKAMKITKPYNDKFKIVYCLLR